MHHADHAKFFYVGIEDLGFLKAVCVSRHHVTLDAREARRSCARNTSKNAPPMRLSFCLNLFFYQFFLSEKGGWLIVYLLLRQRKKFGWHTRRRQVIQKAEQNEGVGGENSFPGRFLRFCRSHHVRANTGLSREFCGKSGWHRYNGQGTLEGPGYHELV